MKYAVFVPGATRYTVSLKEKSVKDLNLTEQSLRVGQYVERAKQIVVASTKAPSWFAENIIRWRLRHGLVLANATVRR